MPGLRRFERVQAAIPVHLEGGGEALSRDLSPGGIFFVTEERMQPGNAIHFTVEFDNPSGKLSLDCAGEIVRVERAGGKLGVAVRITDSRLERRKEGLTEGAHT